MWQFMIDPKFLIQQMSNASFSRFMHVYECINLEKDTIKVKIWEFFSYLTQFDMSNQSNYEFSTLVCIKFRIKFGI